jgi:hypothetical protein
MQTFLVIADLIVVLALVLAVPRAVLRGQENKGAGSLLLSVCVAVAVIAFGIISTGVAAGLAQGSSLEQGILLVVLVAIAIVLGSSWASASAA